MATPAAVIATVAESPRASGDSAGYAEVTARRRPIEAAGIPSSIGHRPMNAPYRLALPVLALLAATAGCARLNTSCAYLAQHHHGAVARLNATLTDRPSGQCDCGECVVCRPAPSPALTELASAPCACFPACPLGHCRLRKLCERPTPGPPPARLHPEMPPKFLPLPTQPILSPARPDAPESWRGDVEAGYRPTLTFPGRD